MPTPDGWNQKQELSFISGLGKPDLPSRIIRPRPSNYAERIVRGYIESLGTRSEWWADADVPKLRAAAERRLLQVAEVPSAAN